MMIELNAHEMDAVGGGSVLGKVLDFFGRIEIAFQGGKFLYDQADAAMNSYVDGKESYDSRNGMDVESDLAYHQRLAADAVYVAHCPKP